MKHESNRPRIMICEDEPVVAMHLAAEVEACGCEALGPFAWGRDALAALRMQRVDAAILDVELADGASTPLARALREAGVRMIVLSGLQTNSPPPEFAGVEWLVKPADDRRIHAFCAEVLAAGRIPDEPCCEPGLPPHAGTSPAPGDLLR